MTSSTTYSKALCTLNYCTTSPC